MFLGDIAGSAIGSYFAQVNYFADEDFESHLMIENMLALMRRFGFLHFCSEEIFTLSENSGRSHFFRRNFDDLKNGMDTSLSGLYWWRGYNPYSENYADKYENLFDALLIFQNDARFYEHINCFSVLFNVSANIINEDFDNLKILKENGKLGLKAWKNKKYCEIANYRRAVILSYQEPFKEFLYFWNLSLLLR